MRTKTILLMTTILFAGLILIVAVASVSASSNPDVSTAGMITLQTEEDGENADVAEVTSSESTGEAADADQVEDEQPEGVSQLILLIGLGVIVLTGLIMAGRDRAVKGS